MDGSIGGGSESRSSAVPAPESDSSSDDDDDDVPLSQRIAKSEPDRQPKPEPQSDSEDDVPLANRLPPPKASPSTNGRAKVKREYKEESESEEEEYRPSSSKKAKHTKPHHSSSSRKSEHRRRSEKEVKKEGKASTSSAAEKRKAKKEEEEQLVWKWWEEEKRDDGVKWKTLEHAGPLFAPPYERLPSGVHFKYGGERMKLSDTAEEVMGFYARMLDHDYTSKDVFNKNFIKDWRKVMTTEERAKILDLKQCDFRKVHEHFKQKSEEAKNRSKEEKAKLKEQKDRELEKYGFAYMDGYKQKIGNFRIEPPGLFRGRGEHPKMGRLKRRTMPEDVIINCSKGSKVPEAPAGHKWREVRHDNTVTWLASWTENIANQNKYIMLNPSSKIKGQKDYEKYEKARELKGKVKEIRRVYTDDFKSKEMRVRQRAVALYFIDKLALRAGNEKDSDDTADTVGCCSLRVEHITLAEDTNKAGETLYKVHFDFLGKDSIRYQNSVQVEKRVFKNVKLFMENKQPGDDLFDRVDTSSLNQHLQTLMPGLTAKVFRTFNASFTLQQQLDKAMAEKGAARMSVAEKVLAYNRANREVAILCNHQRAPPKTFDQSMKNLEEKIAKKKAEVKDAKKQADKDSSKNAKYMRLKEQLEKLKLARTDKEENKEIALGTSKLNYLDPRISVGWCMRYQVPLEKVYSKTHREKFRWAIDMTDESFHF